MKNYAHYSAVDFLEDADFRNWVQSPGASSEAFWQKFLADYPQKSAEVSQARQLLLALNDQAVSGFTTDERQQQILRRIKVHTSREEERPVRKLPAWPYWSVAASVLLLLGLWFFLKPGPRGYSYDTNKAQAAQRLVEKVNTGDTPVSVLFADGSKVRLAPSSRISFPENFNGGEKREVYLSGEAFFEVAKNPDRPFFVYSNELVTKVLGTSFNIRAYETDQDVVVNVLTGKVAVSIAENLPATPGGEKVRHLLLLPNQQATLSRKEAELVRSLVKDPALVKNNAANEEFIFTKTPANEVFETLEAAYGVQIAYDATVFARCELTADLTTESLYEKLDVICKSIEATYKSEDGQILVSGNGCN